MKVGFISSKGGQGVTTLSCAFALVASESSQTTLVPSTDTRACLGIAEGTTNVTPNLRLMDTPSDDWVTVLDGQPGDYTVLVTRACYLSLRRAIGMGQNYDAIVVITEPGRALNYRDVELSLGKPVIRSIEVDPVVARLVDAGLLASSLPQYMRAVAEQILTAATVTVHQ